MLLEFTKLMVGLLIALFHQPIADYVMEHERTLVMLLHQRGLQAPAVITRSMARNIYFSVGLFVASFQILKIWSLLHS